ncbi:hypothetical protein CMK22_08560 [Candidatus Poribacteria bacterium]|nr:hypothetical protein [Candidatus Poribacteria bacterium]
MRQTVAIIFFLSGASGLIYQIIWTRQLTLLFGSTVLAISTVLTAFMAGLALGSVYFGKLADRHSSPIRLYAILEILIGVYALIFPLLLLILKASYILIYRSFNAEFYSLTLVRFAISFLIVLIPTTLMGGTLPTISKFVVKEIGNRGRRIGFFYAVNTFGAAIGTIATGFICIQYLGIQNTIFLAVAINFFVALVAFLIDRHPKRSQANVNFNPTPETKDLGRDPIWKFVLLAFGVSGFCSLAYEVLWTRILVFFLGSTTYAFSTILAAFLLGIALGSYIFAKIVDRSKSLVSLLGLVQISIGLSSILLMPIFNKLLDVILIFQGLPGGRFWTFLVCLLMMGVPATLMGACFPIVTRIYVDNKNRIGQNIGEAYSTNTIGSILGSFSAGFVLIPLIGIRPSIALVVTLNVLVGCTLVFLSKLRSQVFEGIAIGGSIVTMAAVIMTLAWSNTPLFLNSAIFQVQRPGDKLVDYTEGIDASITTLKDDAGVYRLYVDTNQAADASRWDSPSHRVIAHLPLLLHSAPRSALVVGFGMGLTSHSITQHGVKIDAIEISEGVIKAAKNHFTPINNNVFENPLFNYQINDGRNYILMTEKRYDMISTGIIHPLVSAGSSNIYTADFYQLCKRILNDDGIMCQWVPLHRMPEDHLKMVVRTFIQVFPHTTLWYKFTPDFIILIGTNQKLKINYKDFMARSNIPSIRQGLEFDNLDGMSLLDAFMMGEDAVRNYAAKGKIHTDNRPYLEFFNAKSLDRTTQRNVEGLSKHRQRVTPWLANYGQTFDEKKQIRSQINRYFSATQKLITGQIAYAGRNYTKAGQVLGEAFSSNKDDMTIRYNLQVVLGLTEENQQEEITQLEKQLKQKLRQNPKDPKAHFQLAIIYEMQGQLDKSSDAAEESLKYNPNQLELYLFLGPLYERQEKIDRALEVYERLEKIADELPPEILGVMASIYHMEGLADKAIKYAEKAFASSPDSWKVNHLLGNIHLDRKHEKKAIQFYLKAIELAPNVVPPLISLAQLHFSQQQYDQALQSINQAIKLIPEDQSLKELRQQIWDAM